jgi:phenylalanyl-tRNA synthetase beta chain
LKGWLIALLQRLNLKTKEQHTEHAYYTDAISFNAGKLELATIGIVKAEIKKQFDIQSEVFVADVNWENIIQALKQVKPLTVTDIPKFPHVERDLALLVNDDTQANELIKMANSLSNPLIKNVKVFDVYRGDKLPQGKKSYAINFTIQDELKTLVDTEIDAVMQSLIALYTKSGFELRN